MSPPEVVLLAGFIVTGGKGVSAQGDSPWLWCPPWGRSGTGRGPGSSMAGRAPAGCTAPVWVASSSPGRCASRLPDIPSFTFPPTHCHRMEDCRRIWQLQVVSGHRRAWCPGFAHCLCPPACGRRLSLPWSLIPISYGCSLDLRRLEREMRMHIAGWIIYPFKTALELRKSTFWMTPPSEEGLCILSLMLSHVTQHVR